jgi:hypothetical protein
VRRLWFPSLLLLAACGNPQREPSKTAQLSGAIVTSAGARGDAYVFLYAPGEGPPENLSSPRVVTGVSDLEVADGGARYLFAGLAPNPYRLWSFLDTNRNFDGKVDVLSQPGAGDRVSGGVELNIQPGAEQQQDVSPSQLVALEPPALHLEGLDGGSLELPDTIGGVVSFALVTDSVSRLDSQRMGFSVSLIDKDRDGNPDDTNGDGVPDVYPQTFLRWLPRPGQTPPADVAGDVLLPLVFDPIPFLNSLSNDPEREAIVDRLNVFLVPQAQVVEKQKGPGQRVVSLPAIPPGDYELLVIQESGQFWRIPNGLGAELPSQDFRFRVVRP